MPHDDRRRVTREGFTRLGDGAETVQRGEPAFRTVVMSWRSRQTSGRADRRRDEHKANRPLRRRKREKAKGEKRNAKGERRKAKEEEEDEIILKIGPKGTWPSFEKDPLLSGRSTSSCLSSWSDWTVLDHYPCPTLVPPTDRPPPCFYSPQSSATPFQARRTTVDLAPSCRRTNAARLITPESPRSPAHRGWC